MKWMSFSLLAFLALILVACADPPSKTTTQDTHVSEYQTVSYCYTGQSATREELFALAFNDCPAGTRRIELWDHDTFFNSCPVSKKNRVTFTCLSN